jgi:hypothetical protein
MKVKKAIRGTVSRKSIGVIGFERVKTVDTSTVENSYQLSGQQYATSSY